MLNLVILDISDDNDINVILLLGVLVIICVVIGLIISFVFKLMDRFRTD